MASLPEAIPSAAPMPIARGPARSATPPGATVWAAAASGSSREPARRTMVFERTARGYRPPRSPQESGRYRPRAGLATAGDGAIVTGWYRLRRWTMRRREFVQYRSLLQHQLAELLGQGEETVRAMVSRDAEEIPDPNDRGTVESERNWALRLGDRDRRLATKIEAALTRLEQGTYGVCESCGKAISAGRLKARPVTTLCIDCKTESERSEKS